MNIHLFHRTDNIHINSVRCERESAKFAQYHAPLHAIVVDYYLNFVPYFANLFSPLFVFIAVIFSRRNWRGNGNHFNVGSRSLIQTAHASLHDFMCPDNPLVFLSQCLCHFLTEPLSDKISNRCIRTRKKNTSADNVQLQVGKGIIAYIQHYDNNMKKAMVSVWTNLATKNWSVTLPPWRFNMIPFPIPNIIGKSVIGKIRQLKGLREHIISGAQKGHINPNGAY